jgi:SOS-response transcriptional repressor LexA
MTEPKADPGTTRRRVLVALQAFINLHGYSPTVKEFATACGIAPSTCYSHLSRLMADGRVTEEPGRARTLRVVERESEEVAS